MEGISIKKLNFNIFKLLQVITLLIPLSADYFSSKNSGFMDFLMNLEINFFSSMFTPFNLTLISWITFGLIAYYLFVGVKRKDVDIFKIVVLTVYNLFIKIKQSATVHTYSLWIMAILLVYILEVIKGRVSKFKQISEIK